MDNPGNDGKFTEKPNVEIKINSQQLGKKWGKHMTDYPNILTYSEYEKMVKYVFNNQDRIILDLTNNEYLYIKGDNLLRINTDGAFISMYLGVNSGRVTNALNSGGLIWVK